MAIIPDFNVGKDRVPGLGTGAELIRGKAFRFQGMKKGFHRGIIPAVAFATHRRHDPVLGQQRLVVRAGVLAAPIRVEHQARCETPIVEGNGERRVRGDHWSIGDLFMDLLCGVAYGFSMTRPTGSHRYVLAMLAAIRRLVGDQDG